MRLQSFEIRSYKSCLKTIVPIHTKLTTLIGINGAGKSNIMTGILLLRKIFTRFTFRTLTESTNKCTIVLKILHENKMFKVKITSRHETDDHNIDTVRPIKIQWDLNKFFPNSGIIEIPLQLLLEDNLSNNQVYKYIEYMYRRENPKKYANLKKHSETVIPFLREVIQFLSSTTYYSASQFSDPSKSPVFLELEDNRPVRRYQQSPHSNFINDLYNSSVNEDKTYEKFVSLINKDGLDLVENISFAKIEMPSTSYEIKSGGKIKEILKTRVLIVPNFKVDGNILSPNQLSEGTFKTLALLFYILTDKSRVLLIEEPEVCIHHGLLNSIISLIKSQSKQKQIIISTHSDNVLDLLEPQNIVLVKKEYTRGTTAKTLTKHLRANEYRALKNYLLETGNLGEYWKEGGIDEE